MDSRSKYPTLPPFLLHFSKPLAFLRIFQIGLKSNLSQILGCSLYLRLKIRPKIKSLSSGQHSPCHMSMRPFGCHGNQRSDQICLKNLIKPIPHPNETTGDLIKIGQLALEIILFESVDAWMHEEAFGSGELKRVHTRLIFRVFTLKIRSRYETLITSFPCHNDVSGHIPAIYEEIMCTQAFFTALRNFTKGNNCRRIGLTATFLLYTPNK